MSSDLTITPLNNRLYKKRPQTNQDIKRKGQSNTHKRKKRYISDPNKTLRKNFNNSLQINEQTTSLPSNLIVHY